MTDAYRLHGELPSLDSPVLVGTFTGWIDASGAAAAALASLDAVTEARPLATFDPDLFIDYRARRPTMELREGVSTSLVWPEIALKAGRTPDGRDVLLLGGSEPDSNWHRFAEAVCGLALELGVGRAVFFGAYPFACPHTRPSRLACTSPDAGLVAALPYVRSSLDVPAGMTAVLEHALTARGVAALGLWAQVPHYLGAMAYPAASAALLDGLATVTGATAPTAVLRHEATLLSERVDGLIAANSEHRAMVAQLEAAYDAQPEAASTTDLVDGQLPSADELAAEVERFLRDQAD
jgi:hypothetical protein